MSIRVCIDLDGCIFELKKEGQSYKEVRPKKGAIEKLKMMKEKGYYIIIYTSRHMKTCSSNVGRVIAKIGKDTLDLLEKYGVPYDEIFFGKPHADIYIDDNAIRFIDWEYIDVDKLPMSSEKLYKSKVYTLVIPMAGRSKRFFDKGYSKPKYMLYAKDSTIFFHSINSLPLEIFKKIVFVCLIDHEKNYNVSKFIEEEMKKIFYSQEISAIDYDIVFISEVTRGQAETVLKAKNYVNENDYLVIFNIDTKFKSSSLKARLLTIDHDGTLGAFYINDYDSKWSFIKVTSNGIVLQTAEKQQISCIASTGLYTFSKAGDFFVTAERELSENEDLYKNTEFYIAPLYNKLIEEGKKFVIDLVDDFTPLGTPEDVEKFSKT